MLGHFIFIIYLAFNIIPNHLFYNAKRFMLKYKKKILLGEYWHKKAPKRF